MKSFCQIVTTVSLLVLGGCAAWKKPVRQDDSLLLNQVEARWFGLRKSIHLAGWDGETQVHLLYDADPEFGPTSGQVNFLPLAVEGDPVAYTLDPLSGQRAFSHFPCRPSGASSFTYGVVPRHFDQTHNPQGIIVFGGASGYNVRASVLHRVRIVGGVVMQVCPVGSCGGPRDWIGRLVLVAVNDLEERWRDVKNLTALREKVDWESVRSELENQDGRNRMGDDDHPAVKVGELLAAKEVLAHFTRHSVVLNTAELQTLNRTCGKLYARLWSKVGKAHPLDAPAVGKDAVSARARLLEEAKKKGEPILFNERMNAFLSKEGEQLATCARLVYPGDPNGDVNRFTFNSWVALYARMHREGYAFDCRGKAWNVTNTGAKAMQAMVTHNDVCSTAAYDKAFETLPAQLRVLRATNGERWRFVGWDSAAHGSHRKLYSWVRVPERHFACVPDLNQQARAAWTESPTDDMKWVRRGESDGIDKTKVIY